MTGLLPRLRPDAPDADSLCVFVPHVGAGTASFRPLLAHLPPSCIARCVRLPGRERGSGENPEWTAADTAGAVADDVASMIAQRELRLVVVGQCYGAWLAYRIVTELSAAAAAACRGLLVLSQVPPADAPVSPLHLADDEEVWSGVRQLGGTPEELVADPDFRALQLPVLRADLRAYEERQAFVGAPIDVPITAMAGRTDPAVPVGSLRRWAAHTSRYREHLLDSGHWLAEEQPAVIAGVIQQMLDRPLEPR